MNVFGFDFWFIVSLIVFSFRNKVLLKAKRNYKLIA